jgi:hypothetical protein
MHSRTTSSRRRFFWKAGLALSAPLAVGAGAADAAGDEAARARLAELESLDSIRALQRTIARRINRGEAVAGQSFVGVVGLVPVDTGEPDDIALSADGLSATARLHCTVELEQAVEDAGSLAQMARAQGNALARLSARRVLVTDCLRRGGRWEIEAARLVDA